LAAQVEPEALLGDKGYDADSFINSLEVRAIKAVIPPKSTRKVKRACDFALYAERNLVERFFNNQALSLGQHPGCTGVIATFRLNFVLLLFVALGYRRIFRRRYF
jgi:transposase